jgi:hypothetical protein
MAVPEPPAPETPEVSERLDRVLLWSARREYAGFSKFDAFNSPIVEALTPEHSRLRALVVAAWARSPIDLRTISRTKPSRNPKGIALFAMAYLQRYRAEARTEDCAEALRLLQWLDTNSQPGHSGRCWGYDHPWYSLHFYAPRYSPNIVVTGNVAHAFLAGFETTGDEKLLEVARSSVEFMLRDLAAPIDQPNVRSIGYIPGSDWGVLNINGLAASVMARTAKHTGEEELLAEARRLIAFLVDKQTEYGAWNYAWPATSSNVKHDNYHTGNVLDWILDYSTLTGDQSFLGNYKLGLEFYRDHLYLPNGFPKWRSDRVYPADTHSAAQGIVTFAKAAGESDVGYLPLAEKVATWSIRHLQRPEGWFIYQKGRYWTKSYTLMRWCNAWMAYALASLLVAQTKLSGRGA